MSVETMWGITTVECLQPYLPPHLCRFTAVPRSPSTIGRAGSTATVAFRRPPVGFRLRKGTGFAHLLATAGALPLPSFLASRTCELAPPCLRLTLLCLVLAVVVEHQDFQRSPPHEKIPHFFLDAFSVLMLDDCVESGGVDTT